jgi:hypothetical protein
MRFVFKAIPLGALGCAAALLVACGDGEGLLSGQDAGSLQDLLAAAESACASGSPAAAQDAARRFADGVAELSPREIDPRLIARLERGAARLSELIPDSCTATTDTTPTTPTTTVPTETVPTTTTPTTTTDTVPTTPTVTTPTETTPTTPTVPNGGGTPGQGDGNGPPGGIPPGQAKKNGGAGASG